MHLQFFYLDTLRNKQQGCKVALTTCGSSEYKMWKRQ